MKSKLFSAIPPESRRLYLTTILITLAVTLVLQSEANKRLGAIINRQVFHPLVFSIRSVLRPITLDPRIKIFAFDDSTVAYLKATDIPLEEWGNVLRSLTSKGDAHLLIDKLFDGHPKDSDVESFAKTMSEIRDQKTALITFAHTGAIRYRDEVSSDTLTKLQSSVLVDGSANVVPHVSADQMTLYGAPSAIINSFSVFGTANYRGDNYIQPFVRLKSGDIVPNVALSLVGRLNLSRNPFTIEDKPLPINKDGKVLINFYETSVYRKATQSLLPIITRTRAGMDLSILNPGDYVVVLPAMYTGNTDYVDSPFGQIPGGYHLVALLQSALSHDWLREVDDPGFFIIATAAAGFLIGIFIKPAIALGLILGCGVLLMTGSLISFVYLNVVFSFVLPASGLFIGGLCGVILNSHATALDESRKNRELEVAALVQKSFFPARETASNKSSACQTIGIFESASECGGDWWGSFHKNGYTYTLLGDAVGHGVPAALLTSVAFAVSRAIEIALVRADDRILPSDMLTVLNQVLTSIGSSLTQMTFFIMRIHDVTGDCVYANAGNHPPYLIRQKNPEHENSSEKKPVLLNAMGNVLGELNEANFENHKITLVDGDKIILFTDGIYENRVASERSQLGKAWLRKTIQAHAEKPLADFVRSVWETYKRAIGATPPDDDTTIVVIEYRNPVPGITA